jgi:hypothetical protein
VHHLLILQLLFTHAAHSCHEYHIKPILSNQSRRVSCVSEDVYWPEDVGSESKLILHEMVAQLHCFNSLKVLNCCLIVHYPMSSHELDLASLYYLVELLSLVLPLLVKPTVQEYNVRKVKFKLGIIVQCFSH